MWFLHTSVCNLIFSTLADLCFCLFFFPGLGSLLFSRSSAILSRDFPVDECRVEFVDFLFRHSSNLVNKCTDWCNLIGHKYSRANTKCFNLEVKQLLLLVPLCHFHPFPGLYCRKNNSPQVSQIIITRLYAQQSKLAMPKF